MSAFVGFFAVFSSFFYQKTKWGIERWRLLSFSTSVSNRGLHTKKEKGLYVTSTESLIHPAVPSTLILVFQLQLKFHVVNRLRSIRKASTTWNIGNQFFPSLCHLDDRLAT
jgi:hypothetical protein